MYFCSYVVSHGGLLALGNYLSVGDDRMTVVALEGIEAMLLSGDKKMREEESEINPYIELAAELKGIELIVLFYMYT